MMPRSEAELPLVRPTKDEVNSGQGGGWISELNLKASAGRIRPSNARPAPHEVQHRAAGVGPQRYSHAARAIARSSCSKTSAASWKRSQRRSGATQVLLARQHRRKRQEPPSFLANRAFGDIFITELHRHRQPDPGASKCKAVHRCPWTDTKKRAD